MKDFKSVIEELLAKPKGQLTAEDKAFLRARASHVPENIISELDDEVKDLEEEIDELQDEVGELKEDVNKLNDEIGDDDEVYLEDMTVDQIKAFAKEEKIDLKGSKTKPAMIKVIQAMIEEAAKLEAEKE